MDNTISAAPSKICQGGVNRAQGCSALHAKVVRQDSGPRATTDMNNISYNRIDRDVTATHCAEGALMEERRLLHTLMDNLPDLIYFKDRESRFTRINLALARKLDLDHPSLAIGKTDFDFLPAEHAEAFLKDDAELLRTGQSIVDKVEKGIWPDGHVTWLSTTKMPLRDANGNIIGTFGVSRDITDRKRAEEALHDSEDQFRQLADNIHEVFFIGEPDPPRLTYLSPAYEAVWGRPRQEAYERGDAWIDAIHPDDRERAIDLFSRSYQGEQASADYRIVRPDGSVRYIKARAFPVRDAGGKFCRVVGIAEDVTGAVRAEQQTRLQTAALESAANGIVIASREGRIIWVNPAFTRLTGYPASEVIGENPRFLRSGLHDAAFYQKLWNTILSREVWQGEIVNRRKDGTQYTEEMTITPVCDAQGTISHFIAIKQDITARKQAERELRLTQFSVEHASDGIYWMDSQGRIVYANEAACRSLGRSREELLALSIPDIDPLLREAGWGTAWKEVKEQGSRVLVTQHQTKGGRTFPVEVTANYLEFDGKEYSFAFARDVTERMRAEKALRESEERYRMLFERNLAGVFRSTTDGQILECNQAMANILGFDSPQKAREHGALEFYFSDAERATFVEKLKVDGRLSNFEMRLRRKDGSPVWVLANVSLGTSAAGGSRPIEGTFINITKRKLAEATRDYLASIVESSEDAIIGKSLDGIIQTWNRGAEKLYGYAASEVIGQSVLLLVPAERHKEVEDFLHRIKRGERIEPHETVRIAKGGGRLDVAVTISPLKNADGEIVGASTVGRDISERREIERTKSEIVSVVSHELRTPLTSIRGALGLLAAGLLRSQPEKGERMLEIAVSNTDRLVRLINDILDLERLESGKMNTGETNLPRLAGLMTQAADSVRDLAEKAGVTLSVSLHSARLWVDPDRIIQALINLLSNAIKFSPRGKAVWLTATRQADQILFQVKDQGRGIPQEKREKHL